MKDYLQHIGILSFLIFGISCSSTSKEFDNDIAIIEKGLSADKVYVKTEAGQLDNNTFAFAQKILTNFENIEGFSIENGKYYPQMEVTVTDENDNIVLQNNSLFNAKEGLDTSLKVIYGELILANPFQSGNSYTASYKIIDTKGDGVLLSKMNFDVLPNPNIEVEELGIKATEVYIFNSDKKEAITNSKVKFNENLQFQFEGLKGYTTKNGSISLGMSITVTDDNGRKIVQHIDAFKNKTLTQTQIDQGLGGTLTLSKGRVANPITWEIEVWDKNSDSRIKAVALVEVN